MSIRKLCIASAALALAVLSVRGEGTRQEPVRVALTFDDGNKDHLLIVAPMLEERGWRGVFNIVTDWIGGGERSLSWDDVRELIRRGHEVITHTKSHPSLPKLLAAGKEVEVRDQIAGSRDKIAYETGFTPRYMCAPGVQQNAETDRICRELGLRQMNVPRFNFGSNNCDGVAWRINDLLKRGARRADILHHGVAADEHGGWLAFQNRESFRRHLDAIAALEKAGKLIVTDYDGVVSDCALKAKAWPRHGVVALSFDDRNLAAWEMAFPLFERYDACATFFLSGQIDASAICFMRKALAAGHEPGLHGLKHMNADVILAKVGEEAYWREEMEPQLSACCAAGIGIRSFAYPNCSRTVASDAVFFRHGFTRLRGKLDGGVGNPNPYDPKGTRLADWKPLATFDAMYYPAAEYLCRKNIQNVIMGESYHTDIEDILRSVSRAGERAEVVSLVSHGISPDASGINMKTEWLERLLAAAKGAGVVVRGVR